MLDQDTLKNYIKNLSQEKFNSIVKLLLKEIYRLFPTSVDGRGDGGADFVEIPQDGGTRKFLAQATIQKNNWKGKALTDAKKVKGNYPGSQFRFFTNQEYGSADLREIENRISSEVGISATCVGAREITDWILERELVDRICDVLNLPFPTDTKLDQQILLIQTYVAIGKETVELREQIYDDTLQFVLHNDKSLPEQELIKKAVEFLGCGSERESRFKSRLSSLLTRRIVVNNKDTNSIELSEASNAALLNANRIYLSELNSLASSQSSLLDTKYQQSWPEDNARKSAVLLAKLFVRQQIDTLAEAKASMNNLPIMNQLGSPLEDLNEMLLQSGIPKNEHASILKEWIGLASESPAILKLTRGIMYAAIEGGSMLQQSKVLGVTSWRQVTVFVDASVLIPYLCSKLFSPTPGRFSVGAISCLDALIKAGAKVVTSHDYINETAAHLLSAREYSSIQNIDNELLQQSGNGFVRHFYALRYLGIETPQNLISYLSKFSTAIQRSQGNNFEWIRAIMPKIQELASNYGIQYEPTHTPGRTFSDEVERTYGNILHDERRESADIRIRHDIQMISILRYYCSTGVIAMCLTWNRQMIEVAKKFDDCGWVVSPHAATDFIRTSNPPSGEALIALAHNIASTRDRPDRIVKEGKTGQMDWQVNDKLRELKKGMLERMNNDSDDFESWGKRQVKQILKNLQSDNESPYGAGYHRKGLRSDDSERHYPHRKL